MLLIGKEREDDNSIKERMRGGKEEKGFKVISKRLKKIHNYPLILCWFGLTSMEKNGTSNNVSS